MGTKESKFVLGGDVAAAESAIKSLQRTGQEVTSVLQREFDQLGVKSAESFEGQRRAATAAYAKIKASGIATADELARAQKAHADRMAQIDEQQFGKRTTALEAFKKNWLGVTAVLAAGGGLAAEFYRVNAESQKLQASLKTVTGSTEAAKTAFSDLTKFAAETPYQVTEVTSAFVKLKAMGLDPSVDALRSYGNTASAMGKGLDMMIEAVADAATGEFERLKEFGIKAKSQGDQVSFTFQGVTTTVGKNAAEIEAYLRGIGEVQFAGAMSEQMNTLGGATSNLKDSYEGLLRALGDAGGNQAAIQSVGMLTSAINALTAAAEKFALTAEDLETVEANKAIFGREYVFAPKKEMSAEDQAMLARADELLAQANGGAPAGHPQAHEPVPEPSVVGGAGKKASSGASRQAFTLPEYDVTGPAMQRYGAQQEFDQFKARGANLVDNTAAAEIGQRLAALQQAMRSEEQVIEDSYRERMQLAAEARESGVASEQELSDLEVKIAQDREDKLTALKKKGDQARQTSTLATMNVIGNASAQLFGTMASAQDQSSKKGFAQYKAYAIAQAGISTALSVMNALSTVQPWWAAVAAAAVSAAMGAAQIRMISSQQYQGARSGGGPVYAGESYLVGERGPEVVRMNGDGQVTPLGTAKAPPAQQINVTPVFQMSTGVAGTVRAELMAMWPTMETRMRASILAAMREGGDMSRAMGRTL